MFGNYNYFEAILNYGTLSKAAKKLGISQPALSNYISKLEEKLGAVIFDRSSSPIVLTETGKIYYKYLKQSEAVRSEYLAEVGDLVKVNGGTVTIAGASSTTASYLPKATTAFLKKYPNCKIKILDGTVSEISKQAVNGEIDFFITPEIQKNSDFEYMKLLDERLFMCVPEETAKQLGIINQAIDIKDFLSGKSQNVCYKPIDGVCFKDCRFILLENGTNVRNISNALFEKWDYKPENPIIVSQMLTGYNLCANGVGITFLPESILKLGNFGKYPKVFAVDEEISCRSIYACCKKSRYMSGACSAYIDMLKDSLKQIES